MLNIREAFDAFTAEILPAVVKTYGERDTIAINEAWNDYTDSLTKDGELNDLQYHYCPAFDDSIPHDWDDEREMILDAMDVKFTCVQVPSRPDHDEWLPGSRHWQFTITRGEEVISGHFSQGSAITTDPDIQSVFHAILSDADGTDEPFEDWAENLGFDTDSRKAERAYNQCKATAEALERMFSDISLDDLRELFSDY